MILSFKAQIVMTNSYGA